MGTRGLNRPRGFPVRIRFDAKSPDTAPASSGGAGLRDPSLGKFLFSVLCLWVKVCSPLPPRPAAHPRPLHAASRLHCSQGIPKQVFMNSILHFNKLCILDAVSDLQKKVAKIIQRGSHKHRTISPVFNIVTLLWYICHNS